MARRSILRTAAVVLTALGMIPSTLAQLRPLSFASTAAVAQSHTIVPFDLKSGHLVVVKGSIGEIENLNFVIDTGATTTVIADDLSKALGLRGHSKRVAAFDRRIEVNEVTLPVITIGPLLFEGPIAQIGSLAFPDLAEQMQIDALIGLNLLRKTSLVIDYASRKLVFGPIVHSRPPMAFYNKFPFVPVSLYVRGKRVNLFLDTGARDLVLFSHSAERRLAFRRTGEKTRTRSFGGKRLLEKVLLQEVRLGPIEWKELPGYLLEGFPPISQLDGILGIMVLGLKRLNLDFEHGLISFEN